MTIYPSIPPTGPRRIRYFVVALAALTLSCSSHGVGSTGTANTETSRATTSPSIGDTTPATTVPATAVSVPTVSVPADASAAARSAGCGLAPPERAPTEPGGDLELAITVDDTERTYRLTIPENSDHAAAAPVILNLHGSGSNAMQQSIYSQIPARGAELGYIVVTPDAIDGQWERAGGGTDDTFLMTLLDDISARYCVDPLRVSATGISLGAWKATITACTHPDRFASIALVAEEIAPPGCAIPVVAFHGTADPAVPYGAGADPEVVVAGPNAGLPGVEVNMAQWALNGGCSVEPDIARIEPDVEHWIYADCAAGQAVEFYSIEHGGHTWPGAQIEIGPTTQTIDATAIILDWFAAHPAS